MFRLIKGLMLGLIIGALAGGWVGFNKGRNAPLLSNPFKEYTLADDIKNNAGALYKDTKESLRKSLE